MWSHVVTFYAKLEKDVYCKLLKSGADDQNLTGDLLITNQLLYRLSYIGIHERDDVFISRVSPCQHQSVFP